MECLEDLEQPFGCLHCCRNWLKVPRENLYLFFQKRETSTNEVRLPIDPWLTKLSAAFALVRGKGSQLL